MAIYIDNSALTLLKTCETKAWIRWGQELIMSQQEAPGPMQVGSVLHVMFEQWMLGEPYSDDLFNETWEQHIGEVQPQKERLYKENVRTIYKYWLDAQQILDRRVTLLEPEQQFCLKLCNIGNEEIFFYGTIDGLIVWNGRTYLLEHKTTGMLDSEYKARWSMISQPQGYIWALREKGIDVAGAFVNALEIRKLPPWDGNVDKKCAVHKLKYRECQAAHVKHEWIGPLTWDATRLAQWKSDAIYLATRLVEMRKRFEDARPSMDGMFHYKECARCSYKPWCHAGRPLRELSTMMTHQAWRMVNVEDGEE